MKKLGRKGNKMGLGDRQVYGIGRGSRDGAWLLKHGKMLEEREERIREGRRIWVQDKAQWGLGTGGMGSRG